jgi:hypothetical protein
MKTSLKEAKANNLKWYFTGVPCSKGHTSLRQVSNRGCKVCLYEKRQKYEYSQQYIEWKKKNKKSVSSRYAKNNKGTVNANTRKYQLSKAKRTPSWLSKEELERIKCLYQIVDMYNKEKLTKWAVDHKAPLNGKNVSGFHVFNNLRIMPFSDNVKKSNKWNWELQQ